jgi:3-isopropylmalate/(R)-2-methylmalate dehydratase small subunit
VQVDGDVGEALMAAVEADSTLEVTVDVVERTLRVPAIGIDVPFPLDDFTRHRLVEGLDDIGLTLRHASNIDAFEAGRPAYLPTTTA